MPELRRLRAADGPALLAFERANRSYFADFIPDRGDGFFDGLAGTIQETIQGTPKAIAHRAGSSVEAVRREHRAADTGTGRSSDGDGYPAELSTAVLDPDAAIDRCGFAILELAARHGVSDDEAGVCLWELAGVRDAVHLAARATEGNEPVPRRPRATGWSPT